MRASASTCFKRKAWAQGLGHTWAPNGGGLGTEGGPATCRNTGVPEGVTLRETSLSQQDTWDGSTYTGAEVAKTAAGGWGLGPGPGGGGASLCRVASSVGGRGDDCTSVGTCLMPPHGVHAAVPRGQAVIGALPGTRSAHGASPGGGGGAAALPRSTTPTTHATSACTRRRTAAPARRAPARERGRGGVSGHLPCVLGTSLFPPSPQGVQSTHSVEKESQPLACGLQAHPRHFCHPLGHADNRWPSGLPRGHKHRAAPAP